MIEKAARAAAVERSRAHKRRKSINRERLAHWREHSNKDGRSRPPGVNRSPEWRESRSERNMVFRYEAMCASNSEDCFYRVCSVSRNRCRHRHSQCTFLSNDISGVSCIDPIDPTNITSSWMPVTLPEDVVAHILRLGRNLATVVGARRLCKLWRSLVDERLMKGFVLRCAHPRVPLCVARHLFQLCEEETEEIYIKEFHAAVQRAVDATSTQLQIYGIYVTMPTDFSVWELFLSIARRVGLAELRRRQENAAFGLHWARRKFPYCAVMWDERHAAGFRGRLWVRPPLVSERFNGPPWL